jgi:hypothetical protein
VNETVAVGGADLWTETSGSGAAVALLHGGPGLSDNLGSLASLFDDLATVHRYDQRAGGRSTGDPPFTVDRFVEDLDALRTHPGSSVLDRCRAQLGRVAFAPVCAAVPVSRAWHHRDRHELPAAIRPFSPRSFRRCRCAAADSDRRFPHHPGCDAYSRSVARQRPIVDQEEEPWQS